MFHLRFPKRLFSKDTIIFGYFIVNLICWIAFFAVSANIYKCSTSPDPAADTLPFSPIVAKFGKHSEAVDFVRRHVIPASTLRRRKFEIPEEKRTILIKILQGKRNGRFLEVNPSQDLLSILAEEEFNWTGAVVEADSEKFDDLRGLKRRSQLLNVCVANVIGILQRTKKGDDDIQHCVSLKAITEALNMTKLDWLILNAGDDLPSLLLSFPWTSIPVDTVTLPCCWPRRDPPKDNFDRIFLEILGYRLTLQLKNSWTFKRRRKQLGF